jgi:hypothetical protein
MKKPKGQSAMKRIIPATLALLFLFSAGFVFSPAAEGFYFPDIFSGYSKGREEAIRDNYRDQYYMAYDRQAQIMQLSDAYMRTGNFDYLCHAMALGSKQAAQVLFDNDMRCAREVVTVVE